MRFFEVTDRYMLRKKLAKDSLHLLHSDKIILGILDMTNEYFEQNVEVIEKIQDCNWVLRSLFELIPQTVESFFFRAYFSYC